MKDDILDDEKDNYGSLDYRNIPRIQLGNYEFNTWFGNSSVFIKNEPEILGYKHVAYNNKRTQSTKKWTEYIENKKPWLDKLFFCNTCFKYTDNKEEMSKHSDCCGYKYSPPGRIMYCDEENDIIIRRVKGVQHQLFCQCLCILAKFYLDNKSVFYNLDFFDFYIIYRTVDGIPTPMGFYSRELLSWEPNNLSCILVIPCYQKQHLGTKLIEFSYQLSKYEQSISGPERPLSPFGKITYLRYWSKKLAKILIYGTLSNAEFVTLEGLSIVSGFRVEDILMTLSYMGVLFTKGEKNKHVDYYKESYKTRDYDVYLQDDKFNVSILKSNITEWAEKYGSVNGPPTLDEQRLILY